MLRVLMYHRVDDPAATGHLDPALISATPEDFRVQMTHLARWYRPVSLEEVEMAFAEGKRLPRRAVHITFDDGYRDFREVAWPILKELGIPTTLFVATAYPGSAERSFWWDRLHRALDIGPEDGWRREVLRVATERGVTTVDAGWAGYDAREILRHLPHDDMERLVDLVCRGKAVDVGRPIHADILDWSELRELGDEGVDFGAHTRHHVALSRVGPERIRREIRGSLDDMERELGVRPRSLAYPYGMWNRGVARIAADEGCVLGFTCEHGLNRLGDADPLGLRRSAITKRTSPTVFTVRMLPWFARIERLRDRGDGRLRHRADDRLVPV